MASRGCGQEGSVNMGIWPLHVVIEHEFCRYKMNTYLLYDEKHSKFLLIGFPFISLILSNVLARCHTSG